MILYLTRNLIADDFGLKTLYSHQPSTNLLTKELVLHHNDIQERIFHTYDANAVIIKTIEDNGSSDDANNFTDVTERLITTIIPINDHFPSLGKPAEIKESYYDPETKQKCLLRCTKCAYSPHGFLKVGVFSYGGINAKSIMGTNRITFCY